MKGRNPHLIIKRNEYLVKRYYFWYECQRLRIDDVLRKLSEEEIFLDPDYILHLIRQNSDLIKQIKRDRPSTRELEEYVFEYNEPPVMTAVAGTLFG